MLSLLQNAESNAAAKNLDPETLVVSHIQVNRAPKMRRRLYRAHGRINPYQSSPSHIQMILSKKASTVSAGQGRVSKPAAGKLRAGASA